MIWGVFWKKYRKLLGYFLLFALPFGALFLDELRFPKTLLLQKLNSWFIHPAVESVESSVGGVSYIFKNYVSLLKLKETNQLLVEENSKLKLEIMQYKEMGIENDRLRSLIDLKKEFFNLGKVAKIIGEDSTPDRFTFLINIGANQGVDVRSPVLTREGIVGQIKEVYSTTALVITVLDPSHVIDSVDIRSRSHAIIEGTGREYLAKTKYVDRIEDFKVGDVLISSGQDGVFPKGFPIGVIVSVEKPRLGVLQVSRLRPTVDFDKLEEVLVLPPLKKEGDIQVSNEKASIKGTAR